MLETIIDDPRFRRWFPPIAALGLIALFISLAGWQLDRAAGKNRLRELFAGDAPYSRLEEAAGLEEFRNLEATGRYDGERQVLLENMFVEGRIGYFVLTPFQPAAGERWLIVNRGWVARPAAGDPEPDISIGNNGRTLRGRIGHLPRVGIRTKEAFADGDGWPKRGRYPSADELSSVLGEELLPFVLLLSPADENGFVRRWQPRESGSMMHYGYAFQWTAMAAAVLGLLIWQLRKRRNRSGF